MSSRLERDHQHQLQREVGHPAYVGSLADGDIYGLDLKTGEGSVVSDGPGTPSVGLHAAGTSANGIETTPDGSGLLVINSSNATSTVSIPRPGPRRP